MTILRAPVSWLTNLTANANGVRIVTTAPPSQQYSAGASLLPLSALVPASQALVTPANINAIIIIPNANLRVLAILAGIDPASMPGEALQLSVECAADFRGNWINQFQALGFQAFTPVVQAAVPTMCC